MLELNGFSENMADVLVWHLNLNYELFTEFTAESNIIEFCHLVCEGGELTPTQTFLFNCYYFIFLFWNCSIKLKLGTDKLTSFRNDAVGSSLLYCTVKLCLQASSIKNKILQSNHRYFTNIYYIWYISTIVIVCRPQFLFSRVLLGNCFQLLLLNTIIEPVQAPKFLETSFRTF